MRLGYPWLVRIAVCSDEPYGVHATIEREIERHGHQCLRFGAFGGGSEVAWATIAERAGRAIVDGDCSEGVFLCWSGTGISMAANKLPGIRAALCFDASTASAARIWNQANVLCLSNRMLSDDVAKEILEAWFETKADDRGAAGVQLMAEVDERWRKPAG